MGRRKQYQKPMRCNVILEETEVKEVERRARQAGKSVGAMIRELVVSVLSPPPQEPER